MPDIDVSKLLSGAGHVLPGAPVVAPIDAVNAEPIAATPSPFDRVKSFLLAAHEDAVQREADALRTEYAAKVDALKAAHGTRKAAILADLDALRPAPSE